MGVSAGMIAMDAVAGDWPGDSAPLQPCYHVLDELLYPLAIRVSRGVECGSMVAAPAVLTIRRGLQRNPMMVRDLMMAMAERRPAAAPQRVGAGGM